MSECKKTCGNCAGRIESILSKDRCDMTNKPIEDYSNTCNHWEPNRETEIVMQKYELKSLRQERDALQAQVALLRGALLNNRIKFCEKFDNRKNHSTICYPPWGNICEELENCEEIERILSATPSEAAERVQKLVEVEQSCSSESVLSINIFKLQAQVAVLRGALERARKGFVNLIDLNLLPSEEYEKDANKIAQHCFEALASTPSEAVERVQKLVELEQAAREYVESNSIKMSIWFGSSESLQMEKINKLEALRDALDALSEWKRDK